MKDLYLYIMEEELQASNSATPTILGMEGYYGPMGRSLPEVIVYPLPVIQTAIELERYHC